MHAWLVCAGIYGVLGVGFGAFAAHGLEGMVNPERLGWIETGALYQIFHALALVSLSLSGASGRPRAGVAVRVAGGAFALGGVLFPGGLYLAALFGWTWLMPVVPVGGGAFLVGWLALAAAGLRWRRETGGSRRD